MNYFTQKRLFIAAIIVLAVLNIASLVTIWTFVARANRAGRIPERILRAARGKDNPKMILAEELRLTNEQRRLFRQAGERFKSESRAIMKPYHYNKREMFEELAKSAPDTALISRLTDSLGIYQTMLERLTARYFLELKGACTPDQQKRFPEMFHRLMRRMELPETPPPPPPPPPPDSDN